MKLRSTLGTMVCSCAAVGAPRPTVAAARQSSAPCAPRVHTRASCMLQLYASEREGGAEEVARWGRGSVTCWQIATRTPQIRCHQSCEQLHKPVVLRPLPCDCWTAWSWHTRRRAAGAPSKQQHAPAPHTSTLSAIAGAAAPHRSASRRCGESSVRREPWVCRPCLVDDGANAVVVVLRHEPLDNLLDLQRCRLALVIELVADLPQHSGREQLLGHPA